MPRILFIQPTQYGPGGTLCTQKRIYLPGLVFPLLAAMTPSRWEVALKIEVVDRIDFDDPADIVAIGTMGYTIFRAVDIAREFRKRGKLVVMGGYMASLMAEEAAKHVDAVVVGDAEKSYPRMLADFEADGRLKKIYREPIRELKDLPLPRYELLTEKPIGTMLPVQAARGCPYTCSFCSIACMYHGSYLPRPVEEVVRDIRRVKELGFRGFYLIDDNIIGNTEYFTALCKAIIPLKMKWSTQCALHIGRRPDLLSLAKRSGAQIMSLGLESITQEGLGELGKGWLKVDEHVENLRAIASCGILPSTEMMVGTDGDTKESLDATYEFVRRARIPIPRYYILTPMPGSPLFDRYRNEGRLTTEDFSLYDGSRAVFRPKRMTPEELTEGYWMLNRKTFSLPGILLRTLFNPYFFRNPLKYLFALFVNLHYRRYVRKGVVPNIF